MKSPNYLIVSPISLLPPGKRLFFLFFCIVLCSFSSYSASFFGIKRFTIDPNAIQYYQSIDVLLFQRLNFELLPRGIKPLLIEDTLPVQCVSVASGSIDIVDSIPFLRFKITGTSSTGEEVKKIPLHNQPVDVIIDILALKVRHFLEQNLSGKLRISSIPLDCDILLNGIKIGKTPAELLLEQGTYAIQLHKEYLYPYKDSAVIHPGRETSLSTTMSFKGHELKPWIVSASLFTCCAVVGQLLELKFRNDYLNLGYGASQDKFNRYFERFRISNFIKITFLVPTATTWTISIYNLFQNRSLKKQIYGNLNNNDH